MTQSRYLFTSLVLAALPTIVVAAPGRVPQSGRAASGEPFRSFRLLDQKLTLLSNQQSALKAALGAGRVNSSSNNSSSESATVILRRMSSTTTAIDRIAGRLEHLYQSRHESFGVRMFKILRSRAQAVQRDVSSVRRARMPSDASAAGAKAGGTPGLSRYAVSGDCRRICSDSLPTGYADMLPTQALPGPAARRADCMQVGVCFKCTSLRGFSRPTYPAEWVKIAFTRNTSAAG